MIVNGETCIIPRHKRYCESYFGSFYLPNQQKDLKNNRPATDYKMKKKVSIFVDVQNIYYTTRKQFNSNFDYNKFWKLVTHEREVVAAIAYTTNRGDIKQIQFQNILRAIGFEVKLKPFISRSDGSSKGDWDVGITIDIMEHADKCDIVVLASGDGDFDILIEKINLLYNKETEIYGVSNLTANSLKNAASNFFPINNELLLK